MLIEGLSINYILNLRFQNWLRRRLSLNDLNYLLRFLKTDLLGNFTGFLFSFAGMFWIILALFIIFYPFERMRTPSDGKILFAIFKKVFNTEVIAFEGSDPFTGDLRLCRMIISIN